MNFIVINASEESWVIHKDQAMAEGFINGMTLRLRQSYNEKGLYRVSLSGNGWMLSLNVTKQRPRNMPQDEQSEMAIIHFAPLSVLRAIHKDPARASWLVSWVVNSPVARCFHGCGFLSPEAFRKEMSLLRLFNSEWEI